MDKKIAFISAHYHPQSDNTMKILQENFPDYQIDFIRILDIVKSNKKIALFNTFATIKEYGWDIIIGKKKFKQVFFRTVYIFKKIKELVGEKLREGNYTFTFQIGSVYDTSVEGIPHFIYTDHTHLANLDYPLFPKKGLLSKDIIKLEETIYKNATLNFTYSSNITRSIVSQYKCSEDKVICVYAGSNVKVDNHQNLKEKYTNKIILFVGIDWERKGGPELVEAFKKISVIHPDAKLVIIGANPKIHIPNCEVLGRIPIEEVSSYYKNASIFCMPTKREPFGLVFLEAMQYKLPVVATDLGAIPDFVSNDVNGYLVKSGNVDDLAESLNKLLSDPVKCEKFGENGYRLVIEKYTWDKVGKRMRAHILKHI